MKNPKSMTISELVKELEKFDPETRIFLSSDPEGNEIRTLHHGDVTVGGIILFPGGVA